MKSSLAFIQLAKQNERLKEALVRLRDMSTENEQEYKRRIADLEKELDLTSDLQCELESIRTRHLVFMRYFVMSHSRFRYYARAARAS